MEVPLFGLMPVGACSWPRSDTGFLVDALRLRGRAQLLGISQIQGGGTGAGAAELRLSLALPTASTVLTESKASSSSSSSCAVFGEGELVIYVRDGAGSEVGAGDRMLLRRAANLSDDGEVATPATSAAASLPSSVFAVPHAHHVVLAQHILSAAATVTVDSAGVLRAWTRERGSTGWAFACEAPLLDAFVQDWADDLVDEAPVVLEAAYDEGARSLVLALSARSEDGTAKNAFHVVALPLAFDFELAGSQGIGEDATEPLDGSFVSMKDAASHLCLRVTLDEAVPIEWAVPWASAGSPRLLPAGAPAPHGRGGVWVLGADGVRLWRSECAAASSSAAVPSDNLVAEASGIDDGEAAMSALTVAAVGDDDIDDESGRDCSGGDPALRRRTMYVRLDWAAASARAGVDAAATGAPPLAWATQPAPSTAASSLRKARVGEADLLFLLPSGDAVAVSAPSPGAAARLACERRAPLHGLVAMSAGAAPQGAQLLAQHPLWLLLLLRRRPDAPCLCVYDAATGALMQAVDLAPMGAAARLWGGGGSPGSPSGVHTGTEALQVHEPSAAAYLAALRSKLRAVASSGSASDSPAHRLLLTAVVAAAERVAVVEPCAGSTVDGDSPHRATWAAAAALKWALASARGQVPPAIDAASTRDADATSGGDDAHPATSDPLIRALLGAAALAADAAARLSSEAPVVAALIEASAAAAGGAEGTRLPAAPDDITSRAHSVLVALRSLGVPPRLLRRTIARPATWLQLPPAPLTSEGDGAAALVLAPLLLQPLPPLQSPPAADVGGGRTSGSLPDDDQAAVVGPAAPSLADAPVPGAAIVAVEEVTAVAPAPVDSSPVVGATAAATSPAAFSLSNAIRAAAARTGATPATAVARRIAPAVPAAAAAATLVQPPPPDSDSSLTSSVAASAAASGTVAASASWVGAGEGKGTLRTRARGSSSVASGTAAALETAGDLAALSDDAPLDAADASLLASVLRAPPASSAVSPLALSLVPTLLRQAAHLLLLRRLLSVAAAGEVSGVRATSVRSLAEAAEAAALAAAAHPLASDLPSPAPPAAAASLLALAGARATAMGTPLPVAAANARAAAAAALLALLRPLLVADGGASPSSASAALAAVIASPTALRALVALSAFGSPPSASEVAGAPPGAFHLLIRLTQAACPGSLPALAAALAGAVPPALRGEVPEAARSAQRVRTQLLGEAAAAVMSPSGAGGAEPLQLPLVAPLPATSSALTPLGGDLITRALASLPAPPPLGSLAHAGPAGSAGGSGSASSDPAAATAMAAGGAGGGASPIFVHAQLLEACGRGADALRLLLSRRHWARAFDLLAAAEAEADFDASREHIMDEADFSPPTAAACARGQALAASATPAGPAALFSTAAPVATLGDLASHGVLTVTALLQQRLSPGASGGDDAEAAAAERRAQVAAANATAAAASGAAPATRRVGGGSGARPTTSSRRTMRQTFSVATAAATASAVRWREREGPRLAYFHVMLQHALAQGETGHLIALWRRIPAAYPLPAVVATLRASLLQPGGGVTPCADPAREAGAMTASPDAVGSAASLPAWAVLPALCVLARAHAAELEQLARYWRRSAEGAAAESEVLRGWGKR